MIPILSAEHLIVFKAVFDRRKDWLDIEQVLFLNAGDVDRAEITGWMHRIVSPTDQRMVRLARLMDATLGAGADADDAGRRAVCAPTRGHTYGWVAIGPSPPG